MTDKQWTPDVLVLGPGGVKGFLELGALLVLEAGGMLANVHTYSGVSVGSLIALLLVAGYKVKEIISESVDANLFQDISKLNISDIRDKVGLISNEPLKRKATNLLSVKYGFVPTLKQLYLWTALKFEAVTLNLDSVDGVEYLSYETEPDLPCVDAVMLSMNIPLLFYKLKYKDNIYVDGALGNPYPVDRYDCGENKVLGLYIESSRPGFKEMADSTTSVYFGRVIESTMRQLRLRIVSTSTNRCKHLPLSTSVLDTTGLTVTVENKADMIMDGYKAALEFTKAKDKISDSSSEEESSSQQINQKD